MKYDTHKYGIVISPGSVSVGLSRIGQSIAVYIMRVKSSRLNSSSMRVFVRRIPQMLRSRASQTTAVSTRKCLLSVIFAKW